MPRETGKGQTDGKDETGANFGLCGCPEGGGYGGLELRGLSLLWVSIHFPAGWTFDEVSDKGRPMRTQNVQTPESGGKPPLLHGPRRGHPAKT